MKIYNIKDTGKLLDRLAECNGNVELVNREGCHFTLIKNDRRNIKNVVSSFSGEGLSEMELNFSRPEDSVSMMEYLVAM